MPPPIVLDANAFDASGFRHWLRGYRGKKILPAIAYAELGVHVRRRLSRETYDAGLARAGIEVEWLTADLASVAVDLALGRGDWRRNARDYLVGAHALSQPRILVTQNVRDFRFLESRVRTPADLMRGGDP